MTIKKAFDLIIHALLLQKLDQIGIEGNHITLFENYLNDRMQYVNIEGCRSTLKRVILGVLQGSILGPVLFLVFDKQSTKDTGAF